MPVYARAMAPSEVRAMQSVVVQQQQPRQRTRGERSRTHQNGEARVGQPRRHRIHLHRPNQSEISCCVKYTVFGFNVLFWVIGAGLIGIGLWAQVVKNPYSEIGPRLAKFYLDPTLLLLCAGGVVFILGFSGCIGALRENTCLLSFYAILLGVLLLLQSTVSVLAFVSKNWVQSEIKRELNSMIESYREDPDLQSVIDWIQKDWLQCCGVTGPDDWDMNLYFNQSSVALKSPEAGGVPFSCCVLDAQSRDVFVNLYCGHGVRQPNYQGTQKYQQSGCLPKLIQWLNRHVMQVGIGLIAFTVAEILGICFAQNLRSDIFAQRARWMYTH